MTHQISTPNVPRFKDIHPGPHTIARSHINSKLLRMAQVELKVGDLERSPVPNNKVYWTTNMPGYAPPMVDLPRGNTRFRKEGDNPDPSDPSLIPTFTSLEVSEVLRDASGAPLNVIGRTGLRGRGMLDKWGPNLAADPILTRNNPDTYDLELLLIKRGDTGELALPGGKKDGDEQAWETAGRELKEEAGIGNVDLNFALGRTVFAGYVDDSRNTDNAWMESTAIHLHLDDGQARAVTLRAGSDADDAQWYQVNNGLYTRLFASHGLYVRHALEG